MNEKDPIFSAIKSILSQQKKIFIYYVDLDDVGDKYIVFTHQGCDLFNKSSNKLVKSNNWLDLKTIYNENGVLRIEFKQCAYIPKQQKNVETIRYLSSILQRYYSKRELESMGLSRFVQQKIVPSEIIVFSRFNHVIDQKKLNISDESINNFRDMLVFSKNTFLVSQYETNILQSAFLEILPLCRSLHTIVFCDRPGFSGFQFASQLLSRHGHICNYIFEKCNFNEFRLFSDVIPMDNSIISITFKGYTFTQAQMDEIDKYISKLQIPYISFQECVFESNNICLYKILPQKPLLAVLNLQGIFGIDLRQLFNSIPSVFVLSLSECKLDIYNIIHEIKKSNLLRLTTIDISGNISAIPLEDNLVLPSSLTSILANQIYWSEKCFQSFIKLALSNFVSGVDLSLASSKIAADEWVKIFHFLSLSNLKSLRGLSWDYNPVSPLFFRFLMNHNDLEWLSINGCLSSCFPESVNSFVSFINSANNMKSLQVRGEKGCVLGPLSSIVFASLHNLKNVEHLDFSMSICRDKQMNFFLEEIKRLPKLKTVSIEGFNPKSKDSIIELSKFANSNPTITVSRPSKDIEVLSKILSADMVLQISSMFYRNSKYNQSSDQSNLDGPFNCYQSSPIPLISEYFPRKEFLMKINHYQTQIFQQPKSSDFSKSPKIDLKKRMSKIIKNQAFPSTDDNTIHDSQNDKTENTSEMPIDDAIIVKNRSINIEENQKNEFMNTDSSFSLPEETVENHHKTRANKENISINWQFPSIELQFEQSTIWKKYDELLSASSLYKKIREEKLT